MSIDWLTPQEVGVVWGIKTRRVQFLCVKGRVPNAIRKGRMWLIPEGTLKPIDGRTKAAKAINSTDSNVKCTRHFQCEVEINNEE